MTKKPFTRIKNFKPEVVVGGFPILGGEKFIVLTKSSAYIFENEKADKKFPKKKVR